MRILLTNVQLTARTGTETVLYDLARAYAAAGHSPTVFSPRLGEIARDIERAGVPVVSDPSRIPEPPDIIHGHHHVETVRALGAFPGTRGIFVCHDRKAWHDYPPQHPRILRYVAVDLNCRERVVGSGVPEERIRVVHNAVDTGRFPLRGPLPAAPACAAVFSNYAGPGTHLEPVKQACARLGIALDVIGSGSGNSVPHPELVLSRYDLVFAKARCALEAMATGAAVVLCDTAGLGPMVTAANVEQLRPWNFGARCLTRPLDMQLIAGEVRRYDPHDAGRVADYIRRHAALGNAVRDYLSIYREALAEPLCPAGGSDELDAYLGALGEQCGMRGMDPLAKDAAKRIRFSIARGVECVRAGEAFTVAVEVANGAGTPLASLPPYPVHVSYHWLGRRPWFAPVVAEGLRTDLGSIVHPGASVVLTARVVSPAKPGSYRLRMTLVQDGWRWLDQFGSVFADLPVTVRGAE